MHGARWRSRPAARQRRQAHTMGNTKDGHARRKTARARTTERLLWLLTWRSTDERCPRSRSGALVAARRSAGRRPGSLSKICVLLLVVGLRMRGCGCCVVVYASVFVHHRIKDVQICDRLWHTRAQKTRRHCRRGGRIVGQALETGRCAGSVSGMRCSVRDDSEILFVGKNRHKTASGSSNERDNKTPTYIYI